MLRRLAICFVLAALAAGFAVVGSASAAETCPNAAMRSEQGSTFLPDCRAYEKVSPADKNGSDLGGLGTHSTDPTGERNVYVSRAAVPGAEAGQPSMVYADRDPLSGWVAHPIDPPLPAGKPFANFLSFSDDLSHAVFDSTAALVPDAVDGSSQLYLRDNEAPSFERLTPNTLPPSVLGSGTFRPADVTPDYRTMLYEDNGGAPQTADVVTGSINTYAWRDGSVELVGFVPPPGDVSCGNGGPTCVIPADGTRPGSGPSFGSTQNAISRDGDRSFFHAIELATQEQAVPGASSGGQLYVRDDLGTANPADDTTVEVSASQKTNGAGPGGTDPAGPLPALYWTAEAGSGSKVLFTSCEQLTNDSTATTDGSADCNRGDGLHGSTGTARVVGRDLYAYDVDSGHLSDLTTADPLGAKVFGVVGASDDLTRIYFLAAGLLAPGATIGQPNLYLWDRGTTRFIATLDSNAGAGDDPSHAFPGGLLDPVVASVFPRFRARTVRISPDGRYLLLAARAQLTSYDNSSPDCYANRCAEIYLYDAAADAGAGETTCLSCQPFGAPPNGDAALYSESGGFGPADSADPLASNIADSDSHFFFETEDALVSRDSNGKTDVYEWEGGEVHLISSGTSSLASHFAEATPDGDSVFFTTYQRLVASDRDQITDMYVARVDGGFAESAPPTACLGEGCQGARSQEPGTVAPGSNSYVGEPNVRSARSRCPKHKVRRQGRCLAKKHPKRHRRAGDNRREHR